MKRITVIPMSFALMMLLTGCNIIAPLAILLAPDPKVEAAYKLQDRPTVVFVDDRHGVVSPTTLRRVLADRISQDLMLKKVVTQTISPRDAEAVARQRDSHNSMLPIDAIGRAVGAEQVIYVEIIEFTDRIDRYTPRPKGACRVRVLDVTNRVRLFPPPRCGGGVSDRGNSHGRDRGGTLQLPSLQIEDRRSPGQSTRRNDGQAVL